jgi:hypothetical protein
MPVLSDSGRLIPTNEHEAMLLQKAKFSLLPTNPLPIVGNPISPLPAINNKWVPPEKVVPCESQKIKIKDLPRVGFGWQSTQYTLESVPRESWMLFLVSAGISVANYDEGQGYPGLYRCHFANALLAEGTLQLLKVGSEDQSRSELLLAIPDAVPVEAPATPVTTCIALAAENRWNVQYCCEECHSDPSLLIEDYLVGDDPLQGKAVRRKVMLCCNALRLIDGYHPYQLYSEEQLHAHGVDDAVEEILD